MTDPNPAPAEASPPERIAGPRGDYTAALAQAYTGPDTGRLERITDAVLNVRDQRMEHLTATLARVDTELQQLREQLDDERAAKQTAAGAADRFRDVLSEALGHEDENPGDDVLVAKLREHFGKTGPEPTAWRDRLVGYEAIRDQINAAARDGRDLS